MKGERIFTFIILLAIIVITGRFLPGCGEGLDMLTNGSGGSDVEVWEEWSYRRSVTINNSGTAVADYQVNVTLNNDNDFYAKAAANGDDIRFNYNGTSLSYWIENWNPGGDSSIWVKVPSLPGGDTVIYLYYGNPGQTPVSNFDNTFTKNSGLTGLAAQWHMDEGSGTVISDSSANSNTGTITGASWPHTDGGGWYNRSDAGFSAGDSLVFDGADYLTFADDNSLDTTSITITAWLRTGNDVAATQYIVSKWNEGANERSFALLRESTAIYFLTSQSGTLSTVDSQGRGSLSANTWYHVSATSDASNKRIFINGVQSGSSWAWANVIHTGTSILTIGSRDGTPLDLLSGTIDEVSIYNRALSADEIRAISQRRKYSPDVNPSVLGLEEIVP